MNKVLITFLLKEEKTMVKEAEKIAQHKILKVMNMLLQKQEKIITKELEMKMMKALMLKNDTIFDFALVQQVD